MTPSKKRGRPRKSAAQIGTNKVIKTIATRAIKDNLKVSSPLAKVAIVAALGAIVTYVLNKK